MSSVRLVIKRKWRQSGHSSACAPSRRVRLTNQPPANVDRLGDLLALLGVVDTLPGVLVDRFDGRLDGRDVAHADRVRPAHLLQVSKDLGVSRTRSPRAAA
jgi:hypothetical protein